jgi:transcriptional regulator with XRE-family HTH domain
MTTTTARQRATFLLEVALDQERLKQRIAEVLRRERERRHITQMVVATDLEQLSYRQYQRVENGQSMPRWKALEELAGYFDISLSDLLGEEADPAAVEQASGADEILALLDAMDRRLRRIERRLEKLPQDAPQPKRGAQAARRVDE